MARICTGDVWVRSTVRPGVGAGVVDEQRVEVAARRVVLAHVEGLEVVPVGLHLGPFGDLEAEPDEHVLEPLPRLRDEVGVATARLAGELGQVEPLGLDPAARSRAGERLTAAGDRRGDGVDRLVEALSGRSALVDGGERAEPRLQLGEVAPLAEQLGVEGDDLLERARGRDLLEGRVACGGDVVDHGESFLRCEGWAPVRTVATPGWTQVAGRTDDRQGRPRDHPGHRNRRVSTAERIDGARRVLGGLETEHGHGHRHVEALGPARGARSAPTRRSSASSSRPVCLAAGDDARAGRVQSASTWGVPRCDDVPTSRSPACRTDARSVATTGTWNSAPADARTTFGLSTSTVPGVTTTTSTPAASAERRIVPRLPGSPTRSATTTKSAALEHRRVRRRHADDGEQPGRRVRGRDPLGHAGPELVNGGPGPRHRRDPGGDELGLDRPPGGHCLSDERRSLDDERTIALTRTAAPREAPQPLDLRVGEQLERLGSERCLGRLDETGERRRVGHGQIGEDLAIDVDAGGVEPGDEPAVGQVVLSGGGVDPLDPQPPELAFAGAAVTERVLATPHDLLVGGPERPALVAVVALGLLEHLLVAPLGDDTTLHTCHRELTLLW